MKLQIIFIGNKFIHNIAFRNYILRRVEQKNDFVNSIIYFKENDKSLLLELEKILNSSNNIIIITTKQNFSTIGKVISTITLDNQVLKDNMLIPSKVSVFEDASYLLRYKKSIINVLHIDEMQNMPEILINTQKSKAVIHIFDEDRDTIMLILNPIAQTYEVNLEVTQLIEGWLQIDVLSNRYGNISQFINSSKTLLPNHLITASNIILHIIEKLSINNKKLTLAESCTGGLLSYYFTKENGASKILNGSLVTYSNKLKENWLAVSHQILEENGAVSSEVVAEMSEGSMNVSEADYAISVSGIAGDTGGTQEKPVGTVYIGVRNATVHKEIHLKLDGDRNYIQEQSVLFAIKSLLLMDKDTFF